MLKPLSNYVLIEPVEVSNKTKSGLYIPDEAREKPKQGTVVAIGDGLTTSDGITLPMRVSIGDVVLFPLYSGAEIKLDDKKYLLIRESDLYGTVCPQ